MPHQSASASTTGSSPTNRSGAAAVAVAAAGTGAEAVLHDAHGDSIGPPPGPIKTESSPVVMSAASITATMAGFDLSGGGSKRASSSSAVSAASTSTGFSHATFTSPGATPTPLHLSVSDLAGAPASATHSPRESIGKNEGSEEEEENAHSGGVGSLSGSHHFDAPLRRQRRRPRRATGELELYERWSCPKGCGKVYRKNSTVSIRKHVPFCPGPQLPSPLLVANDTSMPLVYSSSGLTTSFAHQQQQQQQLPMQMQASTPGEHGLHYAPSMQQRINAQQMHQTQHMQMQQQAHINHSTHTQATMMQQQQQQQQQHYQSQMLMQQQQQQQVHPHLQQQVHPQLQPQQQSKLQSHHLSSSTHLSPAPLVHSFPPHSHHSAAFATASAPLALPLPPSPSDSSALIQSLQQQQQQLARQQQQMQMLQQQQHQEHVHMMHVQQAAHMRLQQMQMQQQQQQQQQQHSLAQVHPDNTHSPLSTPSNPSLYVNVPAPPASAVGTPVSRVISPLAAVKLTPPSSIHLPSLSLIGAMQSTHLSSPTATQLQSRAVLSPPLPTVSIAHSAFKAVLRRPDAITLPMPVSLQQPRAAATAAAAAVLTPTALSIATTATPISGLAASSTPTPPSVTSTVASPTGLPLRA